MFDSDYVLTGKHAKYLKFLSSKNSGEVSGANIFERYIDVYMNGVVWGLISSRKAPADFSSDEKARIFADVLIKERTRCLMLYKLVILLDETNGLTLDEKIEQMFQNDNFSEEKEISDPGIELFHEYMRGGIEQMYEKFTEGCINRMDYLNKSYEIINEFNDGFKYL